MTAEPLARLDRVSRRFGNHLALDDVTLDIHPGAIVGLLGPNGAGKSTLLSLLQGQRRATTGTVTLFGGDPREPRRRSRLGSTPQETALPPTLRVGEVVDFVGSHYATRVPVRELAAEFGFEDLLRRQTGALSGGQRRRVSVALAFAGRPSLVLLDEPTTGLDVDARHALWAALRRQRDAGVTVVVTSHYLEEIEALAERVVVLGEGRVLADDRLGAVLGRVGTRVVRLATDEPDRVAELPGVRHAEHADGVSTLTVHDSDAYVTELVRSGAPFRDLGVRGATLEEAFLALTSTTTTSTSDRKAA